MLIIISLKKCTPDKKREIIIAIAKDDNNNPIFGPYLRTVKAIDTEKVT